MWGTVLAPNRTTDLENPDWNEVNACNDHDTLAQLRPGVTRFGGSPYQSWRHVAFVQHTAAVQPYSIGCPCRPAPKAKRRAPSSVSPVATVAIPRRNSLTLACCRSSDHCSMAERRSRRKAACGSRASCCAGRRGLGKRLPKARRGDWQVRSFPPLHPAAAGQNQIHRPAGMVEHRSRQGGALSFVDRSAGRMLVKTQGQQE